MANPVQKSSFAQTCNLLSHFMKERGSTFEAKGIETLNLFPSMENNHSSAADQKSKQHLPANSHLYPQLDLRNSCASDPAAGAGAGAQMTVFYGGKVIVFYDLPAEQAKTIMGLAIKASSTKDSSPLLSMNEKTVSNDRAQNKKQQIRQLPLPPPSGSDVQIATRKSLHRFFAKRKERTAAKAPYQANNPSASVSASSSASGPLNSKYRNSNPWEFALKGKSSEQLDLTL